MSSTAKPLAQLPPSDQIKRILTLDEVESTNWLKSKAEKYVYDHLIFHLHGPKLQNGLVIAAYDRL